MTAITGLDDTAFRARIKSDAWTSAELLAHLFSTERIFIERARTIVRRPGHTVVPVSAEVRDEHLGMAKRMPVPQIIHGLLAQRRDTLEFVRTHTDEQLARTLHHPIRGEQTALWQIEHVIEHELEHAQEIASRPREPAEATT
jgi:hypothetical protein